MLVHCATTGNRAFASALLRQALTIAISDGYPDSVLIASPMGRPLYEEMGYEFVGDALFMAGENSEEMSLSK
jgi:hypothetical protein